MVNMLFYFFYSYIGFCIQYIPHPFYTFHWPSSIVFSMQWLGFIYYIHILVFVHQPFVANGITMGR